MLCKHSSYPVFKCFAALIAWRLACRLWVRTAYQDQALCLQPSERARVANQSGKHVRSIHFPGIYPHKNYPQLCTARDIHSLLHQALCDLALFQLPPYLLLPCYSSHSSPPGALNMGALPPPPSALSPRFPCPSTSSEVCYPRWSSHTTKLTAQTHVQ